MLQASSCNNPRDEHHWANAILASPLEFPLLTRASPTPFAAFSTRCKVMAPGMVSHQQQHRMTAWKWPQRAITGKPSLTQLFTQSRCDLSCKQYKRINKKERKKSGAQVTVQLILHHDSQLFVSFGLLAIKLNLNRTKNVVYVVYTLLNCCTIIFMPYFSL